VKSPLALLSHPLAWEVSRFGLDLAFGLYRQRIALLQQWGAPLPGGSMLDIGCGIGHYSTIATHSYLGIDQSVRYITYAKTRYGGPDRAFRAVDVAELVAEPPRFDLVLMVDFLHHLSDNQALTVLAAVRGLARGLIVSFEPVVHQDNPVGQWIIDHDRGEYIRPLPDLERLLVDGQLRLEKSQDLLLGPIKTRAILASSS
jgi:SAM-dependent methyltransferase